MPARSCGRCCAQHRLLQLLSEAAKRPRPLAFWWRDDDAETVTPALERLLLLARRHGLPLALAVVPERATEDLANRLCQASRTSVCCSTAGATATTLPPARGRWSSAITVRSGEVVEELRAGFGRLTSAVSAEVSPGARSTLEPHLRRRAGRQRRYRPCGRLSTFGPAPRDDPHQVNTHLDIFEWRPERRPLSRVEASCRPEPRDRNAG